MLQVGIVGPKESVERIQAETAAYETTFRFKCFEYNSVHEVKEIIAQNNHGIDYWLFSGSIPYSIAKKDRNIQEKIGFIYNSVSDFNELFLKYIFEYKQIPKSISFDLLQFEDSTNFVNNIFNDKGNVKHYVKFYSEETDPTDIAAYHMELWQEKKIDFVITSYPSVERLLKNQSIPCYWIGPTRMNILHTLEIMAERINTLYYKKTQTTCVTFKIVDFDSLKIVKLASYSLEFLLLELKKIVLQYCEQIEGFLVENTIGQYTIFTTRGIAENKMNELINTKDKLQIETKLPILVGVGHADTTYKAEQFATQAINHLHSSTNDQFAIMDEHGMLTQGSLEKQISYNTQSVDRAIIQLLEQTKVSTKVFYRLKAVVEEKNWLNFTAKDLAQALQMSERNAQRILAELVKVELVEVTGEEQRNTRGRTAKVYRITA